MAFSSEPRPPTRVLAAFIDGWTRVVAAPALPLALLLATFVCALPLVIALQGEARPASDDGHQPALAQGPGAGWLAEFAQAHPRFGTTFTHEVLGFGGTVANISAWLDHEPRSAAVVAAVASYLGLWIFLSGGLLDRLARGRPIRSAAFFGACGVYFPRFLRLAVMAGAVYWALFHWLHPFLFDRLYGPWTRDMVDDRQAIAIRAALTAAFLLALVLVNVVVDFAKVRAVVEDRRSMVGALAASLRFLRRRPFRAAGLYLLNALAFIVILRLWYALSPSAAAPGWAALAAGQVYLLARLLARLAFMASEIAFFQGELAHAGYVASPVPVWPDSPAVEAIGTLTDRSR